MQTTTLMLSSISAWAMAGVYDYIRMGSGIELDVLKWGAVIIMAVGLYFGLRTKNDDVKMEET